MSVNIANTINKDFKNICRTCLSTCDLKFSQDNVISNVFYKLTDIHFETTNELPQQICRKCFEKIIEIHTFSLQCKRTHSRLMKWLNNLKNARLNPEIIETNTQVAAADEIIVEQNKIEFIKTENSTDEFVTDEFNIKQEVEEESNELNEIMIPETSIFIPEQNINYFEDDLLKPNTSNIKVENEEPNINDLNDDSNSSNYSNTSENQKEYSAQNKEGKYKCDVCNKTFCYLRSFKKHRSLHGGGRPYKCKYCSKTFSESNNLTSHMRTHGAERPYLCPYCDWDFADLDELTQHKRAHTGKRPYQCSLCNSCFAKKENLTNHLLVHSDEIPCECPVCGKEFKNTKHMTKHRRTHFKDKPFKCVECDETFQNLYNLHKHDKAYHLNNVNTNYGRQN